MNRMGKITLSVLAVTVLLVPVCLSDIYAAEGEGADTPATGPFDIKDLLGDCTVSMSQANTEESVLKWIKDTWLKGIKWDDSNKFPATLGLTAGYDSNLTVTKTAGTEFRAAVAGTPGDKDGTAGSLTFDITDSNNKIEAKGVVCTITAVFDDSSVPCQVLMEDYNAEDTVLAWLNTTWIPQYKAAKGTPATTDLAVIKTKDTVFKPAVAGTKDSKAGTDGSLTFDIVQTVGTGSTTIASGLICTVKAYGYGEITSSDKDVIFEGGLVDGLRVDSKDHELTSDEIGMIIASLGGSKPVMSSDADPSNVIVYDNVLRIQDGDEQHVYVSGDVVRFEGKEYIIQIGDREFSLYLIDGTGWMKFDRETFEQTYSEDGRYQCSTELFPPEHQRFTVSRQILRTRQEQSRGHRRFIPVLPLHIGRGGCRIRRILWHGCHGHRFRRQVRDERPRAEGHTRRGDVRRQRGQEGPPQRHRVQGRVLHTQRGRIQGRWDHQDPPGKCQRNGLLRLRRNRCLCPVHGHLDRTLIRGILSLRRGDAPCRHLARPSDR